MISLKPGVSLSGLQPQTVLALHVVNECYRDYLCVVTSANDSVHTGKPVAGESRDPHYTGRAVDFRLHHVEAGARPALVERIKRALDSDEYLVLWESVGTDNEHLHVQWQGPR